MTERLTPVLGEAWLADYMRRQPQLFDGVTPPTAPAKPRKAGAGVSLARRAPDPATAALRATAWLVRDNGYGSESEFQAAVKVELEALGWHIQESLKGSARGGAVFYGKGWPDLQVYGTDGQRKMFFLELKQPGNIPSPAQVACHARLAAAGFAVTVAYTVQQCLNAASEEQNRNP